MAAFNRSLSTLVRDKDAPFKRADPGFPPSKHLKYQSQIILAGPEQTLEAALRAAESHGMQPSSAFNNVSSELDKRWNVITGGGSVLSDWVPLGRCCVLPVVHHFAHSDAAPALQGTWSWPRQTGITLALVGGPGVPIQLATRSHCRHAPSCSLPDLRSSLCQAAEKIWRARAFTDQSNNDTFDAIPFLYEAICASYCLAPTLPQASHECAFSRPLQCTSSPTCSAAATCAHPARNL